MPGKSRTLRVQIDGKPWRWVYKRIPQNSDGLTIYGKCDWATRTVSISLSIDGLDRLDTEIHEALHAMQGFASEEHVTEVATTLAGLLWRLGYRTDRPEDSAHV
jgi:hypothetical protein